MKRLLSAIILTLIISIRLEAQTAITINPTDTNVGVILGDVVNVRKQPSAASPLIDTVKENDYVKIIQWTNKQETIGEFTDRWVKIKTKKGKEGYLFGAFVFDLDVIYNNVWGHLTYSEYTFGISFNRNGTFSYKWISAGWHGSKDKVYYFEGNFKIINYTYLNTTYISNFRTNNISNLNNIDNDFFTQYSELYLFKFKNTHLFTIQKRSIIEKPIRKEFLISTKNRIFKKLKDATWADLSYDSLPGDTY